MRRIALVLGDSRSPWPPAPSHNATERLAWQADSYAMNVAMASAYAERWCYDLRIYRFLSRPSRASQHGTGTADTKQLAPCAHPTLGGRAAPWCKLLALHDTLSLSGDARYDLAVWLDSDLFFHDTSRSIPALLREYSNSTFDPLGGGGGSSTSGSKSSSGGDGSGGSDGSGSGTVAWFPTNWPWEKRLPNSAFIILRNSPAARQLLADWWGHPLGRRWSHRHRYEQEPLIRMWPHPRAALLVRGGGVAGSARSDWRHMTDLVYASGPGSRADEGRAPTTHYAEGNSIVPAHPFPRNRTWPSQLAALSLEAIARRAARTAAAAAEEEEEQHQQQHRQQGGGEMPIQAEEVAACAHGRGRAFFFKWHHQNVSLSAEPRPPVAAAGPPEWMRAPSRRGARRR